MANSPEKSKQSLDELRSEIDRLDASIHAALIQRMAVVEELAGAKGDAASMRPAREMEVMRSLVAAHKGALPIAHVVGLWREIMANSLMWQAPYSVCFFSDDQDLKFWDLARFHFGSATPLHPQSSAGQVLQEISHGDGAIGILPVPLMEDEKAWWPPLMFAGDDGPRVIAKLPLLSNAKGYDFPDAFTVGNVPQRPTGEDASMLIVLADANLRRPKVADLISAAGIEAKLMSLAPDESDKSKRYVLFETKDFLAEDDERVAKLMSANDAILRARVVGGYARPIDLSVNLSADLSEGG